MTQYIIEVTLVGGKIKYVTDNKTYAPMTDNKDAAMRFTDKEEVEVLAQQYVQFATMFSSLEFTEKATVRIITEETPKHGYHVVFLDGNRLSYASNKNKISIIGWTFNKDEALLFAKPAATSLLNQLQELHQNILGTFKIVDSITGEDIGDEVKNIDQYVIEVNNREDGNKYYLHVDQNGFTIVEKEQASKFSLNVANQYLHKVNYLYPNENGNLKVVKFDDIKPEKTKEDEFIVKIADNSHTQKTLYITGLNENGKPCISSVLPKKGYNFKIAEKIYLAIADNIADNVGTNNQLINLLSIIEINKTEDEQPVALTYELNPLTDDFWKTVNFGDHILIKLSTGDIISCTVQQNNHKPNEGVLVDCYGYTVKEDFITHITKI